MRIEVDEKKIPVMSKEVKGVSIDEIRKKTKEAESEKN